MTDNRHMPSLRRCILFGALFLGSMGLPAQTFVYLIPVPRHIVSAGMPPRLNPADTTEVAKKLTDIKEDALPGSTGSLYHSITSGNTYGPTTNANKADWLTNCLNWLTGTPATPGAVAKPGILQRATAAIENSVTWLDDLVMPELTMRTEQMADFQRALKAYQLLRQMEIMAKSWHGSIFKIDILDIVPVFEEMELDDVGIPSNGVRVGVKYKDAQGKNNILAAFGLDDPFIGPFDKPRLRYKGPHKLSDISFEVESSPYDSTVTDSHALRIGKQGSELLDRVFFEGIMGRNMARGGVYYTSRALDERPSPKLLKERAESARDIRMAQILEEADAYSKAHPDLNPSQVLDHFKDELEWWRMKPQVLYDNQMQRLNRLRDELQPVNNDIVKLESADKLKEESDPQRKTFLDGLYNTYTQLGDSFTNIVNSATGDENEGDNPGPRLLYKANVSYAKATHSAFQEATALRRYLLSKIQADAQRGSAQGFISLWQNVKERQAALARFELQMQNYKDRGNKVIQMLDKMGITPDDIIQGIK